MIHDFSHKNIRSGVSRCLHFGNAGAVFYDFFYADRNYFTVT